jgi:hypothetical protein
VDRIAVDTLLLRTQLPDVTLRPGASVVARVAARGDDARGVIVIAGVPLTAQLPPEIGAGETLKLKVAEVTPERVLLRLDTPGLAAPGAPPPRTHDAPARVQVREPPRRTAGADGGASVTLAFESSVLGRLDLHVSAGQAGVQAVIAAPQAALERARARAGSLRAALAESTGGPAAVEVTARREPLDLYA